MKKVLLIGLSVFCISAMFVSCNKEDVTADNEVESQILKLRMDGEINGSKCGGTKL